MKTWLIRPLFDILPGYVDPTDPIDPLFTKGPAVWPYIVAAVVLVAAIAAVTVFAIRRLNKKK